MKKLKTLFNILLKEFFGKINIKKNKQHLLIYGIMILFFLFISIKVTPANETVDYKALNDTIILGFLQIFSITVIAYIFAYLSIDFSYKLNMFFKTNFINNFQLGNVKKILMILGVQSVSILIIFIQAGIPLIQVLKMNLFIKFIIITFIGINLVFIPLDILVKYLEKNYYQIGMNIFKIRFIVLVTLSAIYVTIYYSSLKVLFHYLSKFDFYNVFSNLNFFYIIIGLVLSITLIFIYCIYYSNYMLMNTEIKCKYHLLIPINIKIYHIKYFKYIKILVRNKKLLFTESFIVMLQLLNYFTIKDLTIANMFSFLTAVIGINFYSYLTNEKVFLKLNYANDGIKIFISLICMYFIVNIPFILISFEQYIYIAESSIVFLLSIYLGIIFPRENNSLNKFLSNFILGLLIMLLAITSTAISNLNIKLCVYIFCTIVISIQSLKTIRRIYEN